MSSRFSSGADNIAAIINFPPFLDNTTHGRILFTSAAAAVVVVVVVVLKLFLTN